MYDENCHHTRFHAFSEFILLRSYFFTPSILHSKYEFFWEWMVVFSRSNFLFVLAWKSASVRSFPWSGKFQPTSELGERSKRSFKIGNVNNLHGSSLLSAVKGKNVNIATFWNFFLTFLQAQRLDETFRTKEMTARVSSFTLKQKEKQKSKKQ